MRLWRRTAIEIGEGPLVSSWEEIAINKCYVKYFHQFSFLLSLLFLHSLVPRSLSKWMYLLESNFPIFVDEMRSFDFRRKIDLLRSSSFCWEVRILHRSRRQWTKFRWRWTQFLEFGLTFLCGFIQSEIEIHWSKQRERLKREYLLPMMPAIGDCSLQLWSAWN